MKIILKSNFLDYYDHAFDVYAGELGLVIDVERFSKTTLKRRDAFIKMQSIGLHTPVFETVIWLDEMGLDLHKTNPEVIVYFDELAHRGEEKQVIRYANAWAMYPSKLCSLYIEPIDKPTSYRYLRIGSRIFWLQYTSNDSWRSNCGTDVEITLLESITATQLFETLPSADPNETPFLAIDFVKSKMGLFFAIDWNTSPGLRCSPIETEMTPDEIYQEIKDWLDNHSEYWVDQDAHKLCHPEQYERNN